MQQWLLQGGRRLLGNVHGLANLHAVGVGAVPLLLLGAARLWRRRLHAMLCLRYGLHADVWRRWRRGADLHAMPSARVDASRRRRHRQLLGWRDNGRVIGVRYRGELFVQLQ